MHQGALNIPVSRGPGRRKKGESAHIVSAAEAAAPGYEGLQGAIVPRLFNLDAAAAYLSISPWTIRDLEAKGVPPWVRVPLPKGGDQHKLLLDKADLDRLIGAWKETAA
jgi:hypothetical protein